MPTRVKICGITRREDAELAAELGAAALGFNFYPPSPRYIAPAAAREIIRRLPPFVAAVGIFADETDAAHVTAVAEEAGVKVLQLHGTHLPADEALGDFQVIRVLNMGRELYPQKAEQVRREVLLEVGEALIRERALRRSHLQAVLLDTADPFLRGGTGRTFNWKLAEEVGQHVHVILAGGLTPENVGEAIKQVHPYAVDVASGVESAPGIKHEAKLRAFFSAVQAADAELRVTSSLPR